MSDFFGFVVRYYREDENNAYLYNCMNNKEARVNGIVADIFEKNLKKEKITTDELNILLKLKKALT
jgi:hypothetical protein